MSGLHRSSSAPMKKGLPPKELLDDLCSRFVLNVPKEDLESFERILFLVENAHWFYEDNSVERDPSLKSLTLKEFTSLRKPVFMYSMGGLAEYCVVPAHALSVLPDSLPYAESAILGCAVFTAYGAMAHAAEVRPGNSVAVIGIGGVGSSCLQIARAFGASDIIAVDVQDEKLQKAKAFGATHTINAIQEDAIEKIREITGGLGVDIAVEALGKPQTFLQCFNSVRDGGKAVMIGLTPAGAVGEVDINRLVRRKIQVIGSYGARARQDLPKLVRLAESGIFNLSQAVSRKYTFEEAGQAFHDLNQGNIVSRAVVEIM